MTGTGDQEGRPTPLSRSTPADSGGDDANNDGMDGSNANAATDASAAGGADRPPNTPLRPLRPQGRPRSQPQARVSVRAANQAAAASAAPRPSQSRRPPGRWRRKLQQGPAGNDDGPCAPPSRVDERRIDLTTRRRLDSAMMQFGHEAHASSHGFGRCPDSA